ncbi:hypothetical protein HDV00_004364 [Rhizophlyctis rosea]|nr:hypothetical protein HDV00_004364 [Rhizophlyctis rosea]
MTTAQSTLTLYDIQLDPKVKPISPNPWKARYVLNYLQKSYKTHWVPFLAVGTTRANLHLPAVRKHSDGSDFPTLPILHDSSTDTLIGDSFDIALYLHNSSTNHSLFPPKTIALHRAFNSHVDAIFGYKGGAALAGYYMPFDPATAKEDQASLAARTPGMTSWADAEIPIGSERRNKMLAEFKEALNELAGWFVRQDEGPFIEGATPIYADFIVGGWLQFMQGCLPEWEEMRGWHGGVWGRLWDALGEWRQVQ